VVSTHLVRPVLDNLDMCLRCLDHIVVVEVVVEDFCSLVVSRFGLERMMVVGAEIEKIIYYTHSSYSHQCF
jgi:hypothetical protein